MYAPIYLLSVRHSPRHRVIAVMHVNALAPSCIPSGAVPNRREEGRPHFHIFTLLSSYVLPAPVCAYVSLHIDAVSLRSRVACAAALPRDPEFGFDHRGSSVNINDGFDIVPRSPLI